MMILNKSMRTSGDYITIPMQMDPFPMAIVVIANDGDVMMTSPLSLTGYRYRDLDSFLTIAF